MKFLTFNMFMDIAEKLKKKEGIHKTVMSLIFNIFKNIFSVLSHTQTVSHKWGKRTSLITF